MDPDDHRRRIVLISAIAGIIIVLSAMDCVLLYCASRWNDEHETDSESLSSTDDEFTDTEPDNGRKTASASAGVRKRSAAPTNAADKRRKKRRISESEEQAMARITRSMERAIDLLKDIISEIQRPPPSRSDVFEVTARAIQTIEKDEGFSDEHLVDAALVITKKPSVANRYLDIKNKKARTSYLLHHMEKLKRGD